MTHCSTLFGSRLNPPNVAASSTPSTMSPRPSRDTRAASFARWSASTSSRWKSTPELAPLRVCSSNVLGSCGHHQESYFGSCRSKASLPPSGGLDPFAHGPIVDGTVVLGSDPRACRWPLPKRSARRTSRCPPPQGYWRSASRRRTGGGAPPPTARLDALGDETAVEVVLGLLNDKRRVGLEQEQRATLTLPAVPLAGSASDCHAGGLLCGVVFRRIAVVDRSSSSSTRSNNSGSSFATCCACAAVIPNSSVRATVPFRAALMKRGSERTATPCSGSVASERRHRHPCATAPRAVPVRLRR